MSKDIIKINMPSKAEYISLIRLTTSGIANQSGMNIDEIEDIKVCVGEACVNVINFTDAEDIEIQYIISDDRLDIQVDNINKNITEEDPEAQLGLLIIKSLMDEVVLDDDSMILTKYIE